MHIIQVQRVRYKRVEVTSPATIANFGPGFDSFGLCLESPVDRISMSIVDGGKAEVKAVGRHSVPTEPEDNCCSFAAMRLAELSGNAGQGFSVTIRKGMKPGSGIGSSAASSVGGALAMAALLGIKDKAVVLEAAAAGEQLVSGTKHFDNVAAALHGGFTAVTDPSSGRVIKIRPPQFQVVVLVPDVSIETRKARGILPEKVPIEDAVRNLSFASGLVHAMMKLDLDAMCAHLDDTLSVPYRKALVPGYDSVREAALDSGALGISLAGSGPAMFAVVDKGSAKVKAAMVRSLKESTGLDSESFVTAPGKGAAVCRLS